MTRDEFRRRLTERANHAGISIPSPLADPLETYFRLLSAWNEKINLTALQLADPPAAAIDRLLIEPIVAAAHVPPAARSVLDVGSGGGSPAIPFALAAPALQLTMVESKSRKAVFLREAVRATGLKAEVITQRLEALEHSPDRPRGFDVVTIRAVRSEPQLLSSAASFLRAGGQLFLFGGSETPPFLSDNDAVVRIALTGSAILTIVTPS